jgi:hypothetical protein
MYQQLKAEHQKPAGLLQPIEIPEWKWEGIAIDFVTGLPQIQKSYDSVWVIIDLFTKSAHFLPVKNTDGRNRQVYQIVYQVKNDQ